MTVYRLSSDVTLRKRGGMWEINHVHDDFQVSLTEAEAQTLASIVN